MEVSIFLMCLDNNRTYFLSLFGLRHNPHEFIHFLLVDSLVAHHCYVFDLCQILQKKQTIFGKAYSMLSSEVFGNNLK